MDKISEPIKALLNKLLTAVINPEFMQIGSVQGAMTAGTVSAVNLTVTFPVPFKNKPKVYGQPRIGTSGSPTFVNNYTDATVNNVTFRAGYHASSTGTIAVDWIAIDPSQPVLKFGGGA